MSDRYGIAQALREMFRGERTRFTFTVREEGARELLREPETKAHLRRRKR